MYKPTIIRQYFIEYLKATTPFFQNIYGGRINPISKKDSYPYATVLDRKSTRLNSSHITISYAVFCLKKKKKKKQTQTKARPILSS